MPRTDTHFPGRYPRQTDILLIGLGGCFQCISCDSKKQVQTLDSADKVTNESILNHFKSKANMCVKALWSYSNFLYIFLSFFKGSVKSNGDVST